jgi:rhodanese-related sulfurtransferase
MNIENLKDNLGTIVDVRSYTEFMGGHVVGSINIALNEIPNHRNKKITNASNIMLRPGNRRTSSTFSIATGS